MQPGASNGKLSGVRMIMRLQMKEKRERRRSQTMDFTIKERLKKGRLSILSVNEKTHTKTAAVVLMIFLAAVGFSGQNSDIGNFVQQVKERATPLVSVDFLAEAKDLDVLKDLIGDAPIVCLGESQHLMSEPYQLKHRVTRFLV